MLSNGAIESFWDSGRTQGGLHSPRTQSPATLPAEISAASRGEWQRSELVELRASLADACAARRAAEETLRNVSSTTAIGLGWDSDGRPLPRTGAGRDPEGHARDSAAPQVRRRPSGIPRIHEEPAWGTSRRLGESQGARA